MHHQEKLSFCILNPMNRTIFADSAWIGAKTVVVMLLLNHRAKAWLKDTFSINAHFRRVKNFIREHLEPNDLDRTIMY